MPFSLPYDAPAPRRLLLRLQVATLLAVALAPAAHPQSDLDSYGSGINPPESLVLVGGSGSLGEVLVLGVDNPLGTQPAGSLALLAVSTFPAAGFPAGLPLPGFGMAGPYGPGELLVSLSAPNPILWVGPASWSGAGQPAPLAVPVPDLPVLLEREIFFQGLLVDPAAGIAVTEGAVLRVNACPGLGSSALDLPVGQSPREVRSADLDGDGDLDLAVVNESGDDLSVLLGEGDGTFAPQVEYPTGFFPLSLDIADVDGDGALDLAVADDGDFGIEVLYGDGAGGFGPPTRIFAAPDTPRSVQAVDLDGDGDIDLCVASEKTDEVLIALNQGGGSFAAPVSEPVGEEPLALADGDLNGDGILDLVTANNQTDDLSILIGTGGGAFAPGIREPVGERCRGIAVADLNGDGVLDLVSANFGSDDLSVLLGLGLGAFAPETRLESFDSPNEIAVDDIDGDGLLDLIVAHDSGLDLASVHFGRGDGSFGEAQPLPAAGDIPHHLTVGDFDGNGSPDAAFSNLQFAARRVVVLLNACAGTPGS